LRWHDLFEADACTWPLLRGVLQNRHSLLWTSNRLAKGVGWPALPNRRNLTRGPCCCRFLGGLARKTNSWQLQALMCARRAQSRFRIRDRLLARCRSRHYQARKRVVLRRVHQGLCTCQIASVDLTSSKVVSKGGAALGCSALGLTGQSIGLLKRSRALRRGPWQKLRVQVAVVITS